jgi:hypothetical protein
VIKARQLMGSVLCDLEPQPKQPFFFGFDFKCEPAQSAVRVLALINPMQTKVSISVACAISTKVGAVLWLGSPRIVLRRPMPGGSGWWSVLRSRCNLVDDPYECIARGAISHPYRTGNEISAQSVED